MSKKNKNKQNDSNNSKNQQAPIKLKHNEKKMSDAEEKKWLKIINQNNQTFMYKLKKEKSYGESLNEKPW